MGQAAEIDKKHADAVYIAIIIDDLGHNLQRGKAFIDLPAPLTFAILPHTTHAHQIAAAAHQARKEIMVHLPMANVANTPIGPGGLTANQPKVEFLVALDAAIKSVPFAQGINNHTGSYLTQQPQQMNWLMSDMKQRDLFFVDSRTTPNSVAKIVADEHQVFASSRDVFLDNDRNPEAIDAAFQYLIKKARQDGSAIAIGHPYPETLKYLKKAIPKLAAEGIQVLTTSSLIALQHMRHLEQRELELHAHPAPSVAAASD